ncbi:hypothetical protein [Massilia sp. DD77]|uniref:hypothetical protein n=1 Tax=Massilia sp. DD77 TaxID=3109349 RepID=UPI00300017D4
MKVELIPEETYTLQFGDHQIEGMRVVSRWNGLIELRNAKREVLIVSAPEIRPFVGVFDTLFGDVFRTAAETKATGVVVVMGSPDLVARLRAAGPTAAPEAAQGEGVSHPSNPSAPDTD